MNGAVHVGREDKQVKEHYYVTSSQKLSHTSCVLSCSLVYFTRLKNIKNVKRSRDGMPKACKQGRDDIIVKVHLQSLIPASF